LLDLLQLPKQNNRNDLKAVMVWIHGGGFITGSGSTEVYGPDFLLTEDVVLVTINYRLGIFGTMTNVIKQKSTNQFLIQASFRWNIQI
jgi:carboxylesterase type B